MSKTLRQFQCRDDLWARVDALAKRRGISTDDVVQAALMQLFKSKPKKEGEASGMLPVPAAIAASSAPASNPVAAAGPRPALPTPAAARPTAPPPGLPRPPGPPAPIGRPAAAGPPASTVPAAASSSGLGISPPKPATMAPRLPRPASAPAAAAPNMAPSPPAPSATPAPKAAPSLPRPSAPAPAPAPTRLPPPAAKPASQQVRPLYLMFENQWYEVDKEEYVIGRGQKFSDLPIKDANISRRHCSIVRRGPDYFIKDLGSTNGVEFEGTRVDNHKIVEGSVYFLCDHELRFSFTPPSSLG
jgi:hypothetical protein